MSCGIAYLPYLQRRAVRSGAVQFGASARRFAVTSRRIAVAVVVVVNPRAKEREGAEQYSSHPCPLPCIYPIPIRTHPSYIQRGRKERKKQAWGIIKARKKSPARPSSMERNPIALFEERKGKNHLHQQHPTLLLTYNRGSKFFSPCLHPLLLLTSRTNSATPPPRASSGSCRRARPARLQWSRASHPAACRCGPRRCRGRARGARARGGAAACGVRGRRLGLRRKGSVLHVSTSPLKRKERTT